MTEHSIFQNDTAHVDRDAFEEGRVPIALSGWLPLEPLPTYAALAGDIETDTVVIGAGLAGASTFLHLVEGGANAVLLEAKQPANGASGRNAGHYAPFVDDLKTFKQWPGDKGARFFDYSVENRSIVYEICEKYGLDADCKQLGMVMATPRRVKSLSEKAEFWARYGYKVDEVGRDELIDMLGTDHFGYGLVWREGGRINPYQFTNGMVMSAAKLGGRVYGDSPVQACTREGNLWRVKTPTASVLTRRVVICTAGNKGNDFFPALGQTSYPMLATALATKPLPPELARKLMPKGAIVEQHPGLYHMLMDHRGRLISSTIPAVGKAYDAEHYFKAFTNWVNKAFPVSRDFRIELESYWSGMMYNTSHIYKHDYPKVFQVDQGVYALLNLGSWGNFMGPMLGKSLGHALAAGKPDNFIMPITTPNLVRWPGRFSFVVRGLGVPALRLAERLGII